MRKKSSKNKIIIFESLLGSYIHKTTELVNIIIPQKLSKDF